MDEINDITDTEHLIVFIHNITCELQVHAEREHFCKCAAIMTGKNLSL
jgi:hypothetical protein